MAEQNIESTATVTTPAPAAHAAKPEEIANALLSALESRTQRAERGVIKSFSEQYGMSEDEAVSILQNHRNQKDNASAELDKIKNEFADYKAQVESEKTAAVKREAVKAALIESGANEKYIAKMMKDVNLDEIALDKDGKLDKAKELVETVKTDWADFFGTVGEKPANIGNPPANAKPVDTSKMTDDEYFAYQRSQKRKD